MGGKCVKLNTTYFPLSKKADIVFENGESCSAYLDEADNFRFAEEYCNDKYNKYNCPVTCKSNLSHYSLFLPYFNASMCTNYYQNFLFIKKNTALLRAVTRAPTFVQDIITKDAMVALFPS
jgi:hypothetical protein